MKIDGIMTNPAPPGQLVIIEGDGLDAATSYCSETSWSPSRSTALGTSRQRSLVGWARSRCLPIELEDGDKSSGVSFTFFEGS
jgi:hypothetical protein